MNRDVNAGDDVYLAKAIEEEIGGNDRTAELGVQVEVRGDRVFLRGTVASAQRKQAVSVVAAGRAPHHEVVNEITVVDPGSTAAGTQPAEETLR